MSITNEQAMQDLLNLKREEPSPDASVRSFRAGLLLGATGAYWRAGIISFAQYRLLTGMQEEKVPA